jgi:hypothetical protein
MNHWKTECDENVNNIHTMNVQYTISIDRPKRKLKGKICMKAKGYCPNQVHLDQMVLGTVRRGGWTT